MKAIYILLVCIPWLTSCNSNNEINGTWTINNDYYNATYRIYDEDNSKKALIIAYNDGTTKYSSQTRPNQYAFKNLKEKEGVYVDAVSGATKQTTSENTNHIIPKHKDTLEVVTFLFGKPLKEIWTRTTR